MTNGTIFYKPKHTVAVVIPIYKSELSEYERVSLDRCFKVLCAHPIILIAPESLSLESIIDIAPPNTSVEYFDDLHFLNVVSYSKLLLQISFYERFHNYKYILIYQLDAFVFSDKLLYWCNLDFDYIGAPWLDFRFTTNYFDRGVGVLSRLLGIKATRVGNGGFSLRNVRSAIVVLKTIGRKAEAWPTNEDVFWSFEVPKHFPRSFKIPDANVAMNFSVELEPKECCKGLVDTLPFGCHGWGRYDVDFWRPIFKEFGYLI